VSKPISLRFEISDFRKVIEEHASEKPHIDYIAAPRTFMLASSILTKLILKGPHRDMMLKLLAIAYAREEEKNLHSEDPAAAWMHLSWSGASRKMQKKKSKGKKE